MRWRTEKLQFQIPELGQAGGSGPQGAGHSYRAHRHGLEREKRVCSQRAARWRRCELECEWSYHTHTRRRLKQLKLMMIGQEETAEKFFALLTLRGAKDVPPRAADPGAGQPAVSTRPQKHPPPGRAGGGDAEPRRGQRVAFARREERPRDLLAVRATRVT